MNFRYSAWDGTQSIDPLDPDELLDLLSQDLLEDGDLRRALERLLMRGAGRRDMRRMGVRDLLEQLRQRREQSLGRYDLGSLLEDINHRLEEIVEKERQGIERLRASAADDASADQSMRDMVEQMTRRKLEALDQLPSDMAGRLQKLMDYEFMDPGAREDFQELLNELRRQMLGEQFENMLQGVQSLTPEDLEPLREMMAELNHLLAKHLRGGATQADFQEFMERFGHFFPPGIDSIEDLIDYLEQQAAQMASLLQSMPEDMRRQLMDAMQALLQDDRLQWDIMQMADLIEQITGRPLGRRYPFSGDSNLGLEEAMQVMRDLKQVDELERQLREAIRDLDFDGVDEGLLRELLGPDAANALNDLRNMARLLEEAGLARRNGRDMELTPRGIRRLGERTLRDIFAELRQDRIGQHDQQNKGANSEQVPETKLWEFGDPFLVDIGATISNAVRRGGPGVPVKIEPADLEVHRREALTSSATVIAMDMSRSMFSNGAFFEAKRVAFALNTLIKTRFPRDYLQLVVFSYFAMELDPERLLQSDWVDWSGTNIELALAKSRELLSKRPSMNRQIILITDWRPRPTWGPFGYEGTVEGMLREVKRCTRSGIRINTFMMDNAPSSMALAQTMMRMNKGRVFFGSPGKIGRYVLVDYLKNKRKRL
ncbi:MAG TPA: VWA domain-containing protein [Dehalococcoidia bacterium]|nr:VWA domain-containing protein [Dehalococcoidia bacterium]